MRLQAGNNNSNPMFAYNVPRFELTRNGNRFRRTRDCRGEIRLLIFETHGSLRGGS